MSKETDPPLRKSVTLPGSVWNEIMEYRHGERIGTEAEAIRRLLLEGLSSERRRIRKRQGGDGRG